ncbi:MAG: cation:proton antiporter [Bdellovibrionota bacterium]
MVDKRISLLFYLAILIGSGLAAWGIAIYGDNAFGIRGVATPIATTSAVSFFASLSGALSQPLPVLLIQVIVTILAARLVGFILKPIRQPNVIHEIIAGILLGPSLLGSVWPSAEAFLFPSSSLSELHMFSMLGLILFMFVVGMELDPKLLRNKGHTAVIVSHVSIVFPFLLGMLLALYLYGEFAPNGVSFLSFALFMGVAMSITAFPVLARIIQDAGLTKTPLGVLALTCAAADDVTAWCLLAFVVAIVKSASIASAVFTVIASIIFVACMLFFVRPTLQRLKDCWSPDRNVSRAFVTAALIVLALSALLGELIGIHALFGAFVAGVAIPTSGNVRAQLMEKLEDVSLLFLLPLFFAFTGLRTQLALVDSSHAWIVCAGIIVTASVGKIGGAVFAARITKLPWTESLALGVLMNTRGLMELVVLNIGYDLGILSPSIFSMLVLMALVTTFLTGPLLAALRRDDALFAPVPANARSVG